MMDAHEPYKAVQSFYVIGHGQIVFVWIKIWEIAMGEKIPVEYGQWYNKQHFDFDVKTNFQSWFVFWTADLSYYDSPSYAVCGK